MEENKKFKYVLVFEATWDNKSFETLSGSRIFTIEEFLHREKDFPYMDKLMSGKEFSWGASVDCEQYYSQDHDLVNDSFSRVILYVSDRELSCLEKDGLLLRHEREIERRLQ